MFTPVLKKRTGFIFYGIFKKFMILYLTLYVWHINEFEKNIYHGQKEFFEIVGSRPDRSGIRTGG